MLGVHVIELDLAEIPAAGPEDLLKGGEAVVEGEAKPPDPSPALCLLQKLHHPKLLHPPPGVPAQAVEKVEVHIVRLKALQLPGEALRRRLPAGDLPAGQLGGQE